MPAVSLPRRLATEFLGTLLLLATVVGSGIVAETHAGGNVAIALLGNTIATGAILIVLIRIFAPLSGAHFNPAVAFGRSFTDSFPGIQVIDMPAFIGAKIVGSLLATAVAAWLFRSAE